MKKNKTLNDIVKITPVTADTLKWIDKRPSFSEQMKHDPANYEVFKKVIKDLAKK